MTTIRGHVQSIQQSLNNYLTNNLRGLRVKIPMGEGIIHKVDMDFIYPVHVTGTDSSGRCFSGFYTFDEANFEFIDEPPPFPQ